MSVNINSTAGVSTHTCRCKSVSLIGGTSRTHNESRPKAITLSIIYRQLIIDIIPSPVKIGISCNSMSAFHNKYVLVMYQSMYDMVMNISFGSPEFGFTRGSLHAGEAGNVSQCFHTDILERVTSYVRALCNNDVKGTVIK